MAIIAETGLDMTRFPTAAHLVSWAGLAPVARQSGPRNRKPGKGQGDVYLKGYCTQAANGAARTETFLGERLRRLSRRLGGNRAKCAVARSILIIISLGDLGAGLARAGKLTCCGECGIQGTIATPVVDVTGAPEVPPVTALIIVTLQ